MKRPAKKNKKTTDSRRPDPIFVGGMSQIKHTSERADTVDTRQLKLLVVGR